MLSPAAPASSPAPAPGRGPSSAGSLRWLLALIGGLLALAVVAYRAVSHETVEARPIQVEYLSDPSGSLALSGAISGANRFQRLSSDGPPPPRGPHWLRLTLPHQASRSAEVVLELANQYVDDVTLYVPVQDGPPARTGQRVPLGERSVRSHLPAVQVHLSEPSDTIAFVRCVGPLDRPSPVRLWPSAEAFRRAEQRQILPLASYCGLWCALLVYNTFVFVVLRDRVVLLYLGYLAAVGVLALIGTNFSAYVFTGPSGLAREVLVLALLALSCTALVQFSRSFLETRLRAPRLDLGLRVLFGLNIVALVATLALFDVERIARAASWFYLAAALTLVALPLAGFYLWIRGLRQAPLFVLAFGCFGAGLVWMILAQEGYAAPDETNGAPFLLGSALELLLLAIAVAHRYRLIREDKDRLQVTYTAQLEADVAARTAELRTANADKDRLISLVAHDVRSPLTSLQALSRSLARDSRQRSPAEIAADAEAIRQRCGDLLTLVDNLLDWGRLRTGQFTRDPAELNLAGLVDAALRPLRAGLAAKDLALAVEIPSELNVHADGHAAQCILRNLVSNAAKFTPAGGRIAVRVVRTTAATEIAITVSDTGIGILPERLAALNCPVSTASAPGTEGEAGVGIGLALCRELAEREGGSLRLESTPGAGTQATFTLPVAS